MNLKVGIVGLPNAGKSTLFNALLKKQVAFAANYPFATIDPNIGVVPVPDERLNKLADIVEKESFGFAQDKGIRPPIVPATVEFVDIAGLVKGAAEGQGLGNKFLSHIREVDLICHVSRYFEDPNVVHVAGDIDPKRDQEIIETELILADLQTLNKQVEPRGIKDKQAQRRWELIESLKIALDSGKPARDVIPKEDIDDRMLVRDLQLLTMKQVLYVANVSEEQMVTFKGDSLQGELPISAQIESELAGLPEEDQKQYLKELGLEKSGLERLIQKAYEMLGLISFLTMGIKEVRAWTIPKGTKAPQGAATIHTDFEKKFIKAEVVSYQDLVALGSKKKAAEVGKLRLEGKEYEMQDGDVVEFKVGA